MRRHLRLLAIPASAALAFGIVGVAAAPTGQAEHRAVAERTAVDPADPCGGSAATERLMQQARQDGVRYDFLAGRTFQRKASGIGAHPIVLPAGTITTKDFVAGPQRIDSGRVPAIATGLVGAGTAATTLTLAKDTSTRKSAVPTVEYRINPLNFLRVSAKHPVIGGFTVLGTPQGHTYNGLRIERSEDARVADVDVTAIPGDMDRPPGETFGINDYKTVGSHYDDVHVDGAGVGAAGFAANGSRDITVCRSTSVDNPISMGFAFWSVKDVTMVDCTATDNGFAGFNFERVSGNVLVKNPVSTGNRWDMRVVSDTGSATYRIEDPDLTHTQVPGKWTVEVPSTYWHHPSEQRLDAIHLYVHGKERPDLLRIVVPY